MTIRYLEHVIDCQNGKLSRQKWPEKGTCLEFEKVHALRSQPLIIYMDFETSKFLQIMELGLKRVRVALFGLMTY